MGPEQEPFAARVVDGIKAALASVLVLPLLVLYLPLWHLHAWQERRAGRPVPQSPWAMWRQERARRRDRIEAAPIYSEASPAAAAQEPFTPAGDSGRVAVVTGGGRRLGALLCRALAELGYRVAVVHHSATAEAEALVAAIQAAGGQAAGFEADLRDGERCRTLLGEVEACLGPLAVLVNNASLFLPTPVAGSAEALQRLDDLLAVNLRAPLWLSLEAGRRMAAHHQGGVIVNVADIWAERPLAGHAAYSASRAGLLMASRALARDLAPKVRVNAITPGAVYPPDDPAQQEAFQTMLGRTPLAKEAGPEGVVSALKFLVTTPYVTGAVIAVDGGRSQV